MAVSFYIRPMSAAVPCEVEEYANGGLVYTQQCTAYDRQADLYCISTSWQHAWAWEAGRSVKAVSPRGYEFDGWYTIPADRTTVGDFPTEADFTVLVTRSAELSFDTHNSALHYVLPFQNTNYHVPVAVARWVPPRIFSVTFDANDSMANILPSGNRTETRRCFAGDALILPGVERYALDEWICTGWYTRAGVKVGDMGELYVPTAPETTLYAHWRAMVQHSLWVRWTPEWATSATWNFVNYLSTRDSRYRPASGSDPGLLGHLSWNISVPASPRTYLEMLRITFWMGASVTYSTANPSAWPSDAGAPPPNALAGEWDCPARFSGSQLYGCTIWDAYIFRQSRSLLFLPQYSPPLACNANSSGHQSRLLYGHKAYTPAQLFPST